MNTTRFTIAATLVGALMLSACATPPYGYEAYNEQALQPPPAPEYADAYRDYPEADRYRDGGDYRDYAGSPDYRSPDYRSYEEYPDDRADDGEPNYRAYGLPRDVRPDALQRERDYSSAQDQYRYDGERRDTRATRGLRADATEQYRAGVYYGRGVGKVRERYSGRTMERREAELRQRFEGSRVTVRREGEKLRLDMQEDVLFPLDSAFLRPGARAIVGAVAEDLRRYGDSVVLVNGYTDTSGTRAHNAGLSEARARAVADELAREGVDPRRIGPRGYGESNLRVPTPDGVREPLNRRVEIVLQPRVS